MKQVNVVPLPMLDMSMGFARHMGDNKYRHYKIKQVKMISELNKDPNWSVVRELARHIGNEEGEPVIFGVLEANKVSHGALMVEPVDGIRVPKGETFKSTIAQMHVFNRLGEFVNKKLHVNKKFMSLVDKLVWKLFTRCLFYRTDYVKTCVMRQLGITYFKGDESKALHKMEQLLCDLPSKGEFYGYLGSPIMRIQLANTIGTADKVFCLVSYFFSDAPDSAIDTHFQFREGDCPVTLSGGKLEDDFEIEEVVF